MGGTDDADVAVITQNEANLIIEDASNLIKDIVGYVITPSDVIVNDSQTPEELIAAYLEAINEHGGQATGDPQEAPLPPIHSDPLQMIVEEFNHLDTDNDSELERNLVYTILRRTPESLVNMISHEQAMEIL